MGYSKRTLICSPLYHGCENKFRTPDLGKAKINILIYQTVHYKGGSPIFLYNN